MHKTISLTVHNRPAYLRQVLASLRDNNSLGYVLNCQLEPGSPECLQICQAVDFMPSVVHLNQKRLGVRENPYQLLRRVFSSGSDFNVYLDERAKSAAGRVSPATGVRYCAHPSDLS